MLGVDCDFGRRPEGDLIPGNILFDVDDGQCAPAGGVCANVLLRGSR